MKNTQNETLTSVKAAPKGYVAYYSNPEGCFWIERSELMWDAERGLHHLTADGGNFYSFYDNILDAVKNKKAWLEEAGLIEKFSPMDQEFLDRHQ